MAAGIWGNEGEGNAAIYWKICIKADCNGISPVIRGTGRAGEAPASVMVSDELAGLVDFFSIGTNDLTQYTLAADRQDAKLDGFYNPRHPAVRKMIQIAVDNAHKHGKWAGICGDLAADLELAGEFVRIGVDELSVPPSMVLQVRKAIRECQGHSWAEAGFGMDYLR